MSDARRRSVVIGAGGTGGHIFPGLALADAIVAREPSAEVAFVGTPRGMESSLIPKAGYALHLVDMVPFSGREKYMAPGALVRSSFQARRVLKRSNASVVAGMGGYASLPLVVAARLARIPALVHESGAVLGRANKLAGRFTKEMGVAFENTKGTFPSGVRPRYIGMPLGPQFADFDRAKLRDEARASFDIPDDKAAFFVMGGSLGATRLNDAAIDLAARWKDRSDVTIVIKAGREHADMVQERLDNTGGSAVAQCISFFERMDYAYAAADLAMTRAGAGTVAELAVTGLPAILVPYPHAIDDHQTFNAAALVEAAGAVMVPDAQATEERIRSLVESLLFDKDRLEKMEAAALTVGRPRAAEELAEWVLSLADSAASKR